MAFFWKAADEEGLRVRIGLKEGGKIAVKFHIIIFLCLFNKEDIVFICRGVGGAT